MKTSEIIKLVCSELRITKADLAKRMGVLPSSFYRKLARESMTLEELQRCLAVVDVSVDLELRYPDGRVQSSQENHELLLERLECSEKELEAAKQAAAFHRRSFRELRTELNSAVGYAELGRKHGMRAEDYLEKMQSVLASMEGTIACALGEPFGEEPDDDMSGSIEDLRGKQVLLVDDNQLNREVLREVLEDHGLLVEEATDGKEAVAAVRRQVPGYYDFLLMDIEMPMMNGYEATMRIRKLPNRVRANVPIIALTSNTSAEDREEAVTVGMDDFLGKPVNSDRLLRSLAKLQ